jgi:hypothetical protein
MLLDRSVLGQVPLVVFKDFTMLLQLLIIVKRNAALQRKETKNCYIFANSCWEVLLEAIG